MRTRRTLRGHLAKIYAMHWGTDSRCVGGLCLSVPRLWGLFYIKGRMVWGDSRSPQVWWGESMSVKFGQTDSQYPLGTERIWGTFLKCP